MILLFKVLFLVVLAGAQEATIEHQDITIKHTVQSGENLHSITRSYLGTDILWQDNWRLNPHIENPNKLKIGDELTIIKERIIPAEKAKVLNVVNRVEKKPNEGSWLSAFSGDELIQQEGVRTYGKSSALLEFNDESKLKVMEFSQIFLQSRSTGLTGTDSATIEVVKGDAELNWEPLVNNQTEIFIVTGGTVSTPQARSGEVAEMRTGLTESGNSVISVYQGNSAVASAGSEVKVKQGMGVAVKPGQAPPEPKPLLTSPKIDDQVSSIYTYTNPIVRWNEVTGAASYLVEMCQDKSCKVVLKQHTCTATKWQISELNQAGQFYLRVAAVSDDELVGFKSATQLLEFSGVEDDTAPPLVALEVSGHSKNADGKLIIGPDARLTLFAHDDLAGVSSLSFNWDGSEWQTYSGTAIALPALDATLQVKAVDHLGLTTIKNYQFITQ